MRKKLMLVFSMICTVCVLFAACTSSNYAVLPNAEFLSEGEKSIIEQNGLLYSKFESYDDLVDLLGEEEFATPGPFSEYDKDFFEKNVLLMVHVKGRGKNKTVDFKNSKISDNVLTVKLKETDVDTSFIGDVNYSTLTVVFGLAKSKSFTSVAVEYA